jgi:hypothetical protein
VYYIGLKIGSQVKHPVIDFYIFNKKNKITAIVLKGYRQGWPGNTSDGNSQW